MKKQLFVRHNTVTFEWLDDDSLRIVREDNGMTIELSVTEFAFLLQLAELHGWPSCPPLSVLKAGGTLPDRLVSALERASKMKDRLTGNDE